MRETRFREATRNSAMRQRGVSQAVKHLLAIRQKTVMVGWNVREPC